jgi:hypothetical protein
MKGIAAVLLTAFWLVGCVSTYMQQFVGKDVREVVAVDGEPVAVVEMPYGRRGYQWYWGGGTVVVPGQSWSTTTGTVGPGGIINASTETTSMPGGVYTSPGCLITYVAKKKDDAWIVESIRYPARLVC